MLQDNLVVTDFSQKFPWEIGQEEYEQMHKALSMGPAGTDAASFTGGRALTFESLEKQLVDVTLSEQRARLWQTLPKTDIRALYDFYNEQTGVGSEWGRAQAETPAPPVSDQDIARQYAMVRHYRDTRNVSDMLQRADTTVNPMKIAEAAGTRIVVHAVDRDLFHGDSTVYPLRMDGIYTQVRARAPQNIVNFGGKVLTSKDFINRAAAWMNDIGGLLTDSYTNPLIHADLEALYSTAERFVSPVIVQSPQGGAFPVGVTAGIAVNAVQTGFGKINLHTDPNCRRGGAFPAAARGDATYRPSAPTAVTGTPGGTGGVIPTGTYYYRVSAVNEYGESVTVVSAQVSVTLGEVVALSITDACSPAATGFRVYRSAKDAADSSDCRLLHEIPITAGGTTAWNDTGIHVPGTGRLYFLTQLAEQASVLIARYTPLVKKNFAQTDWSTPFGLNMSQACRVQAPKFIYIVDNVVATQDAETGWDPLGVIGA